jgi:chromosome segregation ATPase
MPSIQLDTLSAFGRAALKLDTDFSELTRLGRQIERLDIDSDSGLERALKLLEEFAQHGTNISEGIQHFSKYLQEAREQSEIAAKTVSERAQLVLQRKQQQNQTREKLNQLEEKVKGANASLSGFKKENFSESEKRELRAELERLNGDLKTFLAEAQTIKDEAGQSNFKNIERDAQNLLDALRSSSRRVDKVIAGQ